MKLKKNKTITPSIDKKIMVMNTLIANNNYKNYNQINRQNIGRTTSYRIEHKFTTKCVICGKARPKYSSGIISDAACRDQNLNTLPPVHACNVQTYKSSQ